MLNIPKEVKSLFKQNSIRKNLRIRFPNGEREDIVNKNMDGENFSFTERLCAQQELKFGLYEANVLEFQCAGIENIKGKKIEASIEIDVSSIITEEYQVESADNQISLDVSLLKPGMTVNMTFSENVAYFEYSIEYENGYESGEYPSSIIGGHSGFEHTLSANSGSVVVFTIMLEHDVSAILELPKQLDFEYHETEDVSYPFYRINYGTFIVDSCPRQDNMQVRRVTAYSDYINAEDDLGPISPFERAKWSTRFKAKSDHTYNPVYFMLSNISQNINLDLSAFGAFTVPATSLKSKFTETNRLHHGLFKHQYGQREESVTVVLYVNALELNLLNYADSTNLFAYKMGDCLITETDLQNRFLEIVEPYKDRIKGYKSNIKNRTEELLNYVKPFVSMDNYMKGMDMYESVSTFGMSNNGLFDPSFSNFAGTFYKIRFPYKLTLEVSEYHPDSETSTVLGTHVIDVFDKELFDVDSILSGEVEIPTVSATISRSKNGTGEYVLDTEQSPSNHDLLNGLLEINGCFLKKKRDADIYELLWLKSGGLYPSQNLYPSKSLYPSRGNMTKVATSGYKKLWYEEENVTAYKRIVANYTDENGEKAFAEYYEAEYNEEFTEILLQTVTKESDSDYTEVIVELAENNPFIDGMTVYGSAGGFLIEDGFTGIGGDFGFDILVDESKVFFEQKENWSEVTRITLSVDVGSLSVGESFTVSLGTMERTEIPKERKTLDLSDNYILQNYEVYTSYVDTMLKTAFNAIKDISYTPVRLEAVGMPWVEAGDFILISTPKGAIRTIVLDRTLTGIQSLNDSIESL